MTLSKVFLTVGLLSTSFFVNKCAIADDWKFHVAGASLNKSMDDNNWKAIIENDLTLEQDDYYGVLFDFKKSSWPISISLDIFGADDSSNYSGYKETAATGEIHLGVRKYFGDAKHGWQSYLGGGLAYVGSDIKSEFEGSTVKLADRDTGIWLGVGANWYFAKKWYIGLDVRYSTGELQLNGQKREIDGMMAGMTVGLAW